MRVKNIDISMTFHLPCNGNTDLNNNKYSKQGILKALSSTETAIPITMAKGEGELNIIGVTKSKPYAVYFDKVNQEVLFTVDGIIFFGGTTCNVTNQDPKEVITDFNITSFGFCSE